jgi:hypothetical protein
VGEGLYLKGYDTKQTLHPQIVNETLLLSDVFDINEFLALDLLSTGEGLDWIRCGDECDDSFGYQFYV